MIKKILFGLFIFQVAFAGISGVLLNETNGQPLAGSEIMVNGQNVRTDDKGIFQTEKLNAQGINEYQLATAKGTLVLVTYQTELNLQVPAESSQPKLSKIKATLNIHLDKGGLKQDNAETLLYLMYAGRWTNGLLCQVRNYSEGKAEYLSVPAADAYALLISANGTTYITELKGVVPGKVNDYSFNLADLPVNAVSGIAGQRFAEKFTVLELGGQPNVFGDALPVYIVDQDNLRYIGIGQPPSLQNYNLSVSLFSNATETRTVISDIPGYQPVLPGYVLESKTAYHLPNVTLRVFSPSILEGAKDYVCYPVVAPQEIIKE